jgi:hypothetical protein
VVKSRSVASEPALGPGEKVSVLQDQDVTPVEHVLHCLTQADLSETSCLQAISTRFQNRDDDSFYFWYLAPASPSTCGCIRIAKFLACEWKV